MTTTRINTSLYPSSIDTDRSIPHMVDDISEVRAINHNALKDAILAIQTSLGTDPQGAFVSLADRLDDLEDTISAGFISSRGDTITGPSDSDYSTFPYSINFTYDEESVGNVPSRLIFGDDCNCAILLDDRSSETGTFNSPTTSTKWLPTPNEIINNGALSVVPLTIMGNSAYSDISSISSSNLHRRIRIFDDMEITNSLRVKDYIRASNVDISIDNLHHNNLMSKISIKSVVFSSSPGKDSIFDSTVGNNLIWGSSDLYRDPPGFDPDLFENLEENGEEPFLVNYAGFNKILPVQPKVFGTGNLSVDGDVEIQGSLFVPDYMDVIAAQTAVNIDDVRLVVPAATLKRNILFITFSANILNVTNNNSRGGIQLEINGEVIDHPMIYKGNDLASDDIWTSIVNNLDDPTTVFPESFFLNPVVNEGTSQERNRLRLSPDAGENYYSGMATALIISDTTSSGVSQSGGLARFNPEQENVITLRATEGVSTLMHTVVVWATGATNVEVVTGWNGSSPVLESWTPAM